MPTYTTQYPPAHSDTYVKATTHYADIGLPHFATDPALSLTGGWAYVSWLTQDEVYTNQRFHIDLGSAKVIKRIYYENGHHTGNNTLGGMQNFTFWGSNTGAGSFDDLVYANDEGWTQITTAQGTFDQHVALDQADPKYITVTNSTAYRYYAFKFADNYGFPNNYCIVRRIELQTEDAAAGTNLQINIGDAWKAVPAMQINIGDSWKAVAGAQINIGDAWKTIF